jgi:four helix bundle protein
MGENDKKIRSFTDLYAWQEAHKLVLIIYRTTEKFPPKEIFGLTAQMRRAAISVTSNIAEGFSRVTAKDKRQFYSMAQSSLAELENQLIISRDIGYITGVKFKEIFEQVTVVNKLLNGLKRIGRAN